MLSRRYYGALSHTVLKTLYSSILTTEYNCTALFYSANIQPTIWRVSLQPAISNVISHLVNQPFPASAAVDLHFKLISETSWTHERTRMRKNHTLSVVELDFPG